MKMPAVSVIIPSYNHEKYLSETIQSVLDQTYQDFEIVITDDGSTDGTVAQARKFKDPRIRLYTFDKNQGACVAVRKCLDEARGRYIAMLSSDDIFLPDKLEKQVKFLDENPDIWSVFGYARVIDEHGNDFNDKGHAYATVFTQPNRTRFEWLNYFFYKGNCLCHPSALIRRNLYDELGYYDECLAQIPDLDMWVRTCLRHEIYVMPENLIKFRVRAGEANASGNRPVVWRRGNLEFIRVLRHYLEISSTDELFKIFPDAEKYGKAEKDLIPYFIARLAIDNEIFSPIPKVFGINVLYDVLCDEKIAAKLEMSCNFSYRDFIELTGRHDYFNIEAKAEIGPKKEELEARKKELEALLDSNSWKITAPLRWLSSKFGKF